VLAAGGSAATLGRVVGAVLDAPAMDRALALLGASSIAAFAATFDVEPERVRVLPAGLAVLRAAGAELGHAPRLAGGGLREGLVLDLLGRLR
jgi:exopolyphosphatase/pppGpp-phosphohydrolase